MEGDIEKILETLFRRNNNAYDRFTFDCIFRELLQLEFDHEEAKDLILYNCCLSTLVLQERIYNRYYLKISHEQKISKDLVSLRNEIILQRYILPHFITEMIKTYLLYSEGNISSFINCLEAIQAEIKRLGG